MVVKFAVVCALTLHVLLNVLKIPLPSLPFSMKQFQFPPGSFDTVPASVDYNLSSFHQCEFGLTEPEWFCKRYNFAFALVNANTGSFKMPNQIAGKFLQLLDIREYCPIIVSIMTEAMDALLTLRPVVDCAG